MTNTGNWKIGLLLSFTTAMMWGFLPISIFPLLGVLDAYTITFYRLSGGGLLLFTWLVLTGHKPSKVKITKSLLLFLSVAILFLCTNYYSWLKGLELTTPATAQVVIQIAPMLLLLGSVVFFHESFSSKQALGIGIFIIGLLLFFNQRLASLFSELSNYNLGIYYVIFASVTWAVYGLAQKKLLQDFKALELIFIIVTAGALVFLPLASPGKVVELNKLQLWMLGFGAINTAVAYGCFTQAMHYWDTPRVSAVIAIVPVLTLAIGYLQQELFPEFMSVEPINNLSIVGAVVVVIGSAITALSKASSKNDAALLDYD
ncbi:MAG: drug/metabolite transporter (DMT)-like permease [Enterobacterales bacterium]|jgi:drug/metabolite transporter (DMT)-like permease